MAISMVQETPEATVEMYDAVAARLGMEEDPPRGMIVHSAAAMEGGGLRIVDIWESREDLDRFRQERLIPTIEATMREAGREMPGGPPEMTISEIHHLVMARSAV